MVPVVPSHACSVELEALRLLTNAGWACLIRHLQLLAFFTRPRLLVGAVALTRALAVVIVLLRIDIVILKQERQHATLVH